MSIDRDAIARRIAAALPDGSYVNLGIGIPTLVADHIPGDRDVVLHSENGVLGFAGVPDAPAGSGDPDLINAGKQPVRLLPGASVFDQSVSFAMIRGGHVDVAVLGAFQVSTGGDIASWTSHPGGLGGVGGAMDLAVGAKAVYVGMTHASRGTAKLVRTCTLPLTAAGVVDRVYTDLGTFRPAGDRFEVLELAPGVTREAAQHATDGLLDFGTEGADA